jgi:hypothetical protein
MKLAIQNTIAGLLPGQGVGRLAACVALVGAGLLAGTALRPGDAWGDVKDAAQAQAFQTGGQLSVPILKEIAATLHQMDARLSRLETIAQQLRTTKGTQIPAGK